MTDISYADAIAGFRALCREIGPRAEAHVALGTHEYAKSALSVAIYPRGMTWTSNIGVIRESADTLEDLLAKACATWTERRDEYAKRRTTDMAVEIIRQTDAIGHCADAAIRAAGFSDAEILDLGPAACQRATEMASRGPFSIAPAGKSNGAPVLAAAE